MPTVEKGWWCQVISCSCAAMRKKRGTWGVEQDAKFWQFFVQLYMLSKPTHMTFMCKTKKWGETKGGGWAGDDMICQKLDCYLCNYKTKSCQIHIIYLCSYEKIGGTKVMRMPKFECTCPTTELSKLIHVTFAVLLWEKWVGRGWYEYGKNLTTTCATIELKHAKSYKKFLCNY